MAGNYITKLKRLSYGSIATDFELLDTKGQAVSLLSQEDKFVLLSFMKSDCRICTSHLSHLDELGQLFKGKLQNISLVSDVDISTIVSFMEERDYEWPVLKVDNILLLEDYDVKVFPTYVLVNPDGSIAMAPTPMPDENLAILINGFMKRWEIEKAKKQ